MSNLIKKLKWKMTYTKSVYKKLLSALLVLVMAFTSVPVTAFSAEDDSLSDSGLSLNLEWLLDDGTYTTDDYISNSDKKENKSVRLIVSYENKNSSIDSIDKDGITITVPGLRKAEGSNGRQAQNNAVLLESIGVDSSDKKGNSIWYYIYDSTKDEFIIRNKNKIEFNSTFLGSFEICFNVASRLTEDGFKKTLQAEMTVDTLGESKYKPVLSNSVNYSQTRDKDKYTIKYSGESLKEKDGLGYYAGKAGGAVEDYCWVKYNVEGQYKELARGIKSNEKFYFYYPKGAKVIYEGPDTIVKCNEWVPPLDNNNINSNDYDCWVCTKDISLTSPRDYFKNIVVAYPKDEFYDKGKTNVTSYVQLRGTYYEEDSNSLLSEDNNTSELVPFDESGSTSTGSVVFEKLAHGYDNNHNIINRVDLTNNRRNYYSNFNVSAAYPGKGSYNITLTDEKMALTPKGADNTNGYYDLEPNEYSFTGVYFPPASQIYNANGFNINANEKIKIKILREVKGSEVYEVVYDEPYDGKEKKIDLTKDLEKNQNVVGVKIEISGLTTAFRTNGINVQYKFNVSDKEKIASAAKFINYSLCDYEYYENDAKTNTIHKKDDSSCGVGDRPNMVNVYSDEEFISSDKEKDKNDDSQFHLSGQLPYEFNIQDGLGTNKFTCAFAVPDGLSLSCDNNDIDSLINLIDCSIIKPDKSETDIKNKIVKAFISKVNMGGKDRTVVALVFDFDGDTGITSGFNLKISGIPMHIAKDNIQPDKIYYYNMPVMVVLEKPDGSKWNTNTENWPYVTLDDSNNSKKDVQPLIEEICSKAGYSTDKICTSYNYNYASLKKTISQNVECRKSVSSSLTNDFQRVKYGENGYDSEAAIPQVYQNSEYRYKIALDTAVGGNVSNIRVFDALENFKSTALSEKDRWNGIFKEVDFSKAKEILKIEGKDGDLEALPEDYEPTIYYSEEIVEKNDNFEETLSEDNKWYTPDKWEKTLADVKSVAIDFGENVVIPGGYTFYVEIVMISPEVISDDSASPKFKSFTENDAFVYIGKDTNKKCLESAPVPVQLVQYKGSIRINKKDGVDNTRLAGAKFKVTNINDETENYVGTTGSDGSVVFGRLTCGETYIVEEVEAPTGYELGSEKEWEITIPIDNINTTLANTVTVPIVISNNRIPGTVTIVKNAVFNSSVDGKNLTDGVTLAGAEFELYDAEYNLITKVVTGEDGKVTITGLEWGKYYLRETKAPNGYKNDEDKEIEFTVGADKLDQTVNVDNEQIPATLNIAKYEMLEDGTIAENPTPLLGAKFQLLYSSKKDGDYTYLGVYTTDKFGKVTADNLPYGYYYLKEIDLPTGYKYVNADYVSKLPELPQGCTYAVENGGVTGIKFELFPGDEAVNAENNVNFSVIDYNQRRLGTVRFVKSDNGKSGAFVPGAKYVLCKKYEDGEERNGISPGNDVADEEYYRVDVTGKKLTKSYKEDEKDKGNTYFVTKDSAGAFLIENLYWGTYYLREVNAPDGYQLNKEYVEFSVKADTVGAGTAGMEIKTSSSDDRIPGKVTLRKIDEAGNLITETAKFRLYKDEKSYGEYETTNGEITVENLPWGAYKFEEISAPAGYSISDKIIDFTINASFNNLSYDFVNKPKTSELTISKTIDTNDIVFAHGTPTFTFRIEELDDSDNVDNVVTTYHRTIVFDEGSVKKYSKDDGTVTLSTTVTVKAAQHRVTELETNRYTLSSITAYTKPDGSNITTDGTVDEGCAKVNMKGAEGKTVDGFVNFKNKKIKQSSTSSSSIKTNTFANGKLSAISAKWNGDRAFTGNTIDKSKITVTAQYDNNSMKVIDSDSYVLKNQNDEEINEFDYNVGTMIIKVSYTEDGITRTTSFTVEIVSVSDLFTWQVISEPTADNPYGTARITGYTGSDINIEIPKIVFGLREWNDDESKIAYDSNNTSVYDVTEIGYCTDTNANTFDTFRINKGLRDYLSNNDLSLNIYLPESIVKISDNAFKYDENNEYSKVFKSLAGVQPIGSKESNKLILPNSVTEIGNSAFKDCTGLSGDLKFPDSVTVIGDRAFQSCININGELKLPNNDKGVTIGLSAFRYCYFVNGINIPENVTSIGNYAFAYSQNTDTDKENKTLTFAEKSKLKRIGDGAFYYDCSLGGELKLPDSITYIGENAFLFTGITKVTLPNNDKFTTINKQTFMDCHKLSSIDFGENSRITEICHGAFARTKITKPLIFPDSITTIGNSAFRSAIPKKVAYSTYAVYVEFGTGIRTIGDGAFFGCDGIDYIKFASVKSKKAVKNLDKHIYEEKKDENGNIITATYYVKIDDNYQLEIKCENCPTGLTIGSEAFLNLTELFHFTQEKNGTLIETLYPETITYTDSISSKVCNLHAIVFPPNTSIGYNNTFKNSGQHSPTISVFLPQVIKCPDEFISADIKLYKETVVQPEQSQ